MKKYFENEVNKQYIIYENLFYLVKWLKYILKLKISKNTIKI